MSKMARLMKLDRELPSVLRSTTAQALRSMANHDAIVIGSGAAGGLAALLLTEAGLRVLVLDASSAQSSLRSLWRHSLGGLVRRLSEPTSLSLMRPALMRLGNSILKIIGRRRQPIQSLCYAWGRAPNAFVDDLDCPYVTPPDHPFVWIRARLLGGRMAVPGHGRQYYRLSKYDLAPGDRRSPDWPVKFDELEKWYQLVERRLELSGMNDGLSCLPDSQLSTILEPTPSEAALRSAIKARWPGATPVLGRFAPPLDSLETAALTGRLLCRQGAIVREIDVDRNGHVQGVVWLDENTRALERASTRLVFLCASALESTRILLTSRPPQFPEGLGGTSGVLGRNLMDHVTLAVGGAGPTLAAEPTPEGGRCVYLPRFDLREFPESSPGRGFGIQVYQFPSVWGGSHFTAVSFAEMLPRPENRVTLDPTIWDAWGIPVLRIECTHSAEELAQAREQTRALRELAELAGAKISWINETPAPPGSAIHECGTARMGNDPASSVLDPYNQCWEAQGLYVTDGACFPSQGTQSPTLTILALTARACDHALQSASGKKNICQSAS